MRTRKKDGWLLAVARTARIAARTLFAVMVIAAASSSLTGQENGLAFRRAEHLKHGINLSHWFAQAIGGQYTKEHLETYDTAQDMAVIKSMGFDHVRFTLNAEPMFRRGQADRFLAGVGETLFHAGFRQSVFRDSE